MIPIHYEDADYIVVEKPENILVHPYKESSDRECVLKLLRDQIGQYLYPVHRLDRPVSGLLLFARHPEAAAKIKELWLTPQIEKHYLTLCRRQIKEAGTFDFELSNEKKVKQPALTTYMPLHVFDRYTFLTVQIFTGRKHQIRRHFSRLVYNLVGDTSYGKGVDNQFFREELGFHRLFLHAYKLSFFHPYKREQIKLFSALPKEMEEVLVKLGLANYKDLICQ
jgi:tRNA pseudouridine65 synthase